MQNHLETVHNLKGTLCPICSKAFSKSDAVIDHFKMSHLEVIAKLTCAICKLVYSKMEVLISHYQDKHKHEVKQDSAEGSSESSITPTYRIPKKNKESRTDKVCTICESKFDNDETLFQHYLTVHHPYIMQRALVPKSKLAKRIQLTFHKATKEVKV
ncbi:unnamed protein product [Callosobruchus maculatus]|uniref:C2H2-type domain-containing protein n=1 Tax=Callosobruchus maculatus TaxID=64391 RepID=A0A653C218_CALMS|nr:unnamed protein product [Callosobruchus maculatus]